MDGLLVIDKPAGPTSHDVVARMRRVLGERRVGHTGTLDPAATGVLPLVLGRATRLARFLSGATKSYEATIRLGVSTDTYDAEGAPRGRAVPRTVALARPDRRRARRVPRDLFAAATRPFGQEDRRSAFVRSRPPREPPAKP